jgi:hypothetical protein
VRGEFSCISPLREVKWVTNLIYIYILYIIIYTYKDTPLPLARAASLSLSQDRGVLMLFVVAWYWLALVGLAGLGSDWAKS